MPAQILFCLVLINIVSGLPDKKMEGFIVGGKNANIRDWPFIGFLLAENLDDVNMKVACGSSLISSQTVLTAAHCTDDLTQKKKKIKSFRFTVFFGHSEYVKSKMIRAAIDYEADHKYDPDSEDVTHDISLMFLARPVKFSSSVKKVLLIKPYMDPTVDKFVQVAGWGRTRVTDVATSSRLKSVNQILLKLRVCKKKITDFMPGIICADTREEFAYRGDSGGPLIISKSRWLIGVVSYRDEITGITAYTSIASYYNWIKNNQNKLFHKHCGRKIATNYHYDVESEY